MLIGATVLCFLVLLALLADRAGARLWGGHGGVFYRCEACDLRYPRRDLSDPAAAVCPAGHPVHMEQRGTTASTVGIFVCAGFLCVALLLLISGVEQ